jgi:hypothetical protein
MKIKGISYSCQDVYEKKWTWLKPQVDNGDRPGRPRPLWFCPLARFIHPVGGLGRRNSEFAPPGLAFCDRQNSARITSSATRMK